MSLERKIIKVLSIIAIVEGLLLAVIAILSLTGVVDFTKYANEGYIGAHGASSFYISAALLILGVFELFDGFFGIKGANNPSKMFPYMITSTAAVTYYGSEFLHTLLEGSIGFAMLLNAVAALVVWFIALKIYKDAQA